MRFQVDQATMDAHKAAEVNIKKTPERESLWWEVEVPGVKLDNSILTGSSGALISKVKPADGADDSSRLPFRKLKDRQVRGQEFKGCVLVWRVAEKGGTQIEEEEDELADLVNFMNI